MKTVKPTWAAAVVITVLFLFSQFALISSYKN